MPVTAQVIDCYTNTEKFALVNFFISLIGILAGKKIEIIRHRIGASWLSLNIDKHFLSKFLKYADIQILLSAVQFITTRNSATFSVILIRNNRYEDVYDNDILYT